MIVYPSDWRHVGEPIQLGQIEETLKQIVSEIPSDSLSFSGGLDSSLLLYFMLEAGKTPRVFTITCSDNHPDVHYSMLVVDYFKKKYGVNITGFWRVANGVKGDDLVKVFYSNGLSQHTNSIIVGDGIDEFMAGYYAHQRNPVEDVYYDYLRRLQTEHLAPLHDNSGSIKVYLPYIDTRLTSLLSLIPLADKVDRSNRKKVMVELAKGKVPDEVIGRRKYGFGTSP